MGHTRVGPEIIGVVREVVEIVRHFVDHPDEVEVIVKPGPYRVTVELYTSADDVGQVVGRSGHLKASMRSFLAAISGKYRIKIDLDYVTEEDNARRLGKRLVSG